MANVVEFGKELIETRDLDPVYVVLWETKLQKEELCKWLLPYWCFYHMGTANWICSQPDYWKAFHYAASNKEHPRASERRHFRGGQAMKSIAYLQGLKVTPQELINSFDKEGYNQCLPFMSRVKTVRGFGDWIAFKVADMCERLDLVHVEFSKEDVFNMYESPREGAEIVAKQNKYKRDDPCGFAYSVISLGLKGLLAPPRYERPINIQEIETILCKFKSHYEGRYPKAGKDIKEIHEGLLRYNQLELSQRMLQSGKQVGMW